MNNIIVYKETYLSNLKDEDIKMFFNTSILSPSLIQARDSLNNLLNWHMSYITIERFPCYIKSLESKKRYIFENNLPGPISEIISLDPFIYSAKYFNDSHSLKLFILLLMQERLEKKYRKKSYYLGDKWFSNLVHFSYNPLISNEEALMAFPEKENIQEPFFLFLKRAIEEYIMFMTHCTFKVSEITICLKDKKRDTLKQLDDMHLNYLIPGPVNKILDETFIDNYYFIKYNTSEVAIDAKISMIISHIINTLYFNRKLDVLVKNLSIAEQFLHDS
jgi:hypothetical protein